MHSFRSCAIWASLLIPSALLAQDITTEGTLSIAGGGALLDGDRPAFQRIIQQKKDGYGGIEEYRLTREDKDSVLRFNARALIGDDDYKLGLRYERTDRFYFDAGFEQFRVYYDGSGGFFRPTGQSFVMFNEDLSLTRSKMWAEFGAHTANKTLIKLRYQRNERDGTKDSTFWGDSNLVGAPYGTRAIVPSFYDLDEVTNLITVDVGNEESEEVKWNVGARYSETTLNNARWSRRRPFETADRQITTKDQSKNDIFAVHGFYARKVNEKLTVSAGALRTDLDATIRGSRIYGQSYDPVYDPAYIRRQQRDEGYYDLTGSGEIKQTILNANVVYIPKQHWSIRPSLRFENRHLETMAEFIETNIGASPSFAAIREDAESDQKQKWNELSEALEVRFTGIPNWTFSGKADWSQAEGDHDEQFVVHHTTVVVDREVENKRISQKYAFSANWYVKPGLTFAAQYYFKNNMNDFKLRRDNTDNSITSGNRYPSFLTNQDFETNDYNLRMSWRPMTGLNLVTRYDNQQSKIMTQGDALDMVTSSQLTSHIISQSATWSATGRLYLTGNVNVTYDQMETPAIQFVQHSDNNYVNASLGGGYAVSKNDDLYLDYSWFRANNFIDRSATLLPYGVSQKTRAGYLTWVRRQSETLVYTVKYGYVTNRDETWSGLNNFDAHVIYGRVQYRF
jgi:hypothetical protein